MPGHSMPLRRLQLYQRFLLSFDLVNINFNMKYLKRTVSFYVQSNLISALFSPSEVFVTPQC